MEIMLIDKGQDESGHRYLKKKKDDTGWIL